jgi:membrane protein YdbS with pleckstrin-like domain
MKLVIFRSAVSLGLIAFLFLVFGITTALMVRAGALIGLTINAVVILLIIVLFKTTRYFLTEHGLEIRCGLYRQFIPWKDIRKVKYTSNPISSPAFSFKRIQIDYGIMGSVLISPRTRESFMSEYKKMTSLNNASDLYIDEKSSN